HLLIPALLVLPALLPTGCGSGGSANQSSSKTSLPLIASGTGPNGPAQVSPHDFSATVDNPYYPLKPGTPYRYRGVKDGKPTIDVYAISSETKSIAGARASRSRRTSTRPGSWRNRRPTGTPRTPPATSGTSARRPAS